MPSFLEITGLSRSQRIRIGGLSIPPDTLSFPNLGLVDPPATAINALVKTTAEETGASGGLKKGKFYVYVLTSVDGFGNESTASPIIGVKAGGGAEGAGSANFNKIEWTPTPHATKYRIYRSPAAGGASAAAAEAEALTLIGEVAGKETAGLFAPVIQTSVALYGVTYTDEGAANKTAEPPLLNMTRFNVFGGAYSTRKEVKNHSTEGAIIVYGGPTSSNLDWVPVLEGHAGAKEKGKETGAWGLTLEAEKAKWSKSLQQVQRSTGRVVTVEEKEGELTGIKAGAGKERFAFIVYNTATHQIQGILGAEETEGSATALAKLKEKVNTYQQILYLLRVKNSVGEKVVENVTEALFGGANSPAIASQP
jgi:hypothetical protein